MVSNSGADSAETVGAGSFTVLDHGFWQRAFGGDRERARQDGLDWRRSLHHRRGAGAGGPAARRRRICMRRSNTARPSAPRPQPDGARNSLDVIGRARPGVSGSQIEDDLQATWNTVAGDIPAIPTADSRSRRAPLREIIIGDVADPAARSPGCGNSRVAGGLCQRRQPAARPGIGTRRELAVRVVDGRRSRPAVAAAADRVDRALAERRCCRVDDRLLGDAGSDRGAARRYSASRRGRVEGTVVLFTFGARAARLESVLGSLPALQATRQSTAARTARGRLGCRPRAAARIASEPGSWSADIAISVVLLTGAGLLIRSFVAADPGVVPGFKSEQAIGVPDRIAGRSVPRRHSRFAIAVTQFEARLRALPAVTSAAVTTVLPLSGLGGLVDFSVVGASASASRCESRDR